MPTSNVTSPAIRTTFSPQDRQAQAKILERVLLVALVVSELSLPQYLVLWLQTGFWQVLQTLWGVIILLCANMLFGLRLIRQDRHELAARLMIIGMYAMSISSAFVLRNAGPLVAIIVFIIAIAVGVQTLPSQEIRWILSSGILVTAFTITLDLISVPTQIVVPIISAMSFYLGAVVIIGGVITIFRQFRLFSLENKIALSFLLVALIPVGGLAFLNDQSSRNTLTNLTNQTLLNAGVQTGQVIDSFYRQNLALIQVQAQASALKNYLALPPEQRGGSVEEIEVEKLLRSYTQLDKNIISYGLMGPQGEVIWSTTASEDGSLAPNGDLLNNTQATASPVKFVGVSADQPTLQFTSPIQGESAEALGWLYVRYDAKILQDFIAQTNDRGGPDSFAILLDENYLQLANGAQPELVFKTIGTLSPEKIAQLQAEQRLPAGETEISANFTDFETALNQLNPSAPFFTTQFTGTTTSSAAVVKLSQQPWQLVVLQPQESFLEAVATQTRIVLFIALGMTALVAIAAIAVAGFLAQPIVRLTAVAQQIAAGDLNARADISLGDEIGVMARSFNDMTGQLTHTLRDLDERAKALATNTEVGQKISTILDEQLLVQEVVNQVHAAFNYYYVQIYLMEADGKTLRLASGSGEVGKTLRARGHQLQVGRGLVGRAGQTNQAVIVPNTTLDSNWLPNPLLPETKSEVAVPIAIGDRVLGVMDVQHNVPDSLQEEVADLLRSLATQVAIALQNAWAYANSQNLYSLSNKIAAADTLQQVLTALAEAFPLPVVNRMVLLQYLLNEQGEPESAIVAGTWHNGQGQIPEPVGARYPPSLFSALSPLLGATPTMLTDALNDVSLSPEAHAVVEHLNLRGFAGLPLYVGPRQIGILLLQCETPHAFEDEELQPYLAAAGPIAIAMDNQRLLAQAQDRLRREQVLREVTTQVRSALDVETILQRTAQEVGRALGRRVFVRLGTSEPTSRKQQ